MSGQKDRLSAIVENAIEPPPAVAGLSRHEAATVEEVATFHHEHYRQTSTLQHAIDRLTNRIGRPLSLLVVVSVLALWAGWAAVITQGRVDEPVFAWLEFAATVAALIVAMMILVTQRREDELADRRAQLTLELALLADRRSAKIISLLEELRRDQPGIDDRDDPESEEMAEPTDAGAVAAAIDARSRATR